MFTPDDAAEALQAGQTATNYHRRRRAARLTKKFWPWFRGLAARLEPFQVSPEKPAPMLHPNNPWAWTWPVEILSPAPGNPAVGVVLVSLFADRRARASYHLEFQPVAGTDARVRLLVQEGVTGYADETFGDDCVMGQMTIRYTSLGDSDG